MDESLGQPAVPPDLGAQWPLRSTWLTPLSSHRAPGDSEDENFSAENRLKTDEDSDPHHLPSDRGPEDDDESDDPERDCISPIIPNDVYEELVTRLRLDSPSKAKEFLEDVATGRYEQYGSPYSSSGASSPDSSALNLDNIPIRTPPQSQNEQLQFESQQNKYAALLKKTQLSEVEEPISKLELLLPVNQGLHGIAPVAAEFPSKYENIGPNNNYIKEEHDYEKNDDDFNFKEPFFEDGKEETMPKPARKRGRPRKSEVDESEPPPKQKRELTKNTQKRSRELIEKMRENRRKFALWADETLPRHKFIFYDAELLEGFDQLKHNFEMAKLAAPKMSKLRMFGFPQWEELERHWEGRPWKRDEPTNKNKGAPTKNSLNQQKSNRLLSLEDAFYMHHLIPQARGIIPLLIDGFQVEREFVMDLEKTMEWLSVIWVEWFDHCKDKSPKDEFQKAIDSRWFEPP